VLLGSGSRGQGGRPVEATLDIYDPAGKKPFLAKVWSEDGEIRPIDVVLELPKKGGSIAVRNLGEMDFPIEARVQHEYPVPPSPEHGQVAQTIQGGALKSYPMDPNTRAVEVLCTTNGMPMNLRIEVLDGPNTNKQVIELYSKDGLDRPFFAIIPVPWAGQVVRVLNTSPMEYPLTVSVVPAMQ
jgi:hypothetical protein